MNTCPCAVPSCESRNDKLHFHEFSLNNIQDNPTILIIGKNKTDVVTDLIYHFNIPHKIIINQLEQSDRQEPLFFPAATIFDTLDDTTIKKIFNQKKLLPDKQNHSKFDINNRARGSWNTNERGRGSWNANEKTLVVLNVSQKNFKWSSIDQLIFNGRFFCITYIMIIPDVNIWVPPAYRVNFDYVFLLPGIGLEPNIKSKHDYDICSLNIKNLYQHYGELFPNCESFLEVIKIFASTSCSMVITNRGNNSILLHNLITFYRPQVPGILTVEPISGTPGTIKLASPCDQLLDGSCSVASPISNEPDVVNDFIFNENTNAPVFPQQPDTNNLFTVQDNETASSDNSNNNINNINNCNPNDSDDLVISIRIKKNILIKKMKIIIEP
jgi:hypothetical protein